MMYEFVDASMTAENSESKLSPIKNLTNSLQIFYYPWYGSPNFDGGAYYHWNHEYLHHWNPSIAKKYALGVHTPPSDIGSSYYPSLGPYSSRDPSVIEQHMQWIASAAIDVIVISWLPAGLADDQGHPWDNLMLPLLDAAGRHNLKVSFHMEPYRNRNAVSIRRDIEYLAEKYFNHSAVFKTSGLKGNLELPMLYFYDSYLVPVEQWKKLTSLNGELSVRNTKYDIIFIGLIVKSEDRYSLVEAHFDGMYTYFAAERFTYGSTLKFWPSLSVFCRKNGLLFIPSVGPGYDDRRVRPWNAENYRNRSGGQYYQTMFRMARTIKADIITITSFNEWHEGTQIEPAQPFYDRLSRYRYSEYSGGALQYLELTKALIEGEFEIGENANETIVPAS